MFTILTVKSFMETRLFSSSAFTDTSYLLSLLASTGDSKFASDFLNLSSYLPVPSLTPSPSVSATPRISTSSK